MDTTVGLPPAQQRQYVSRIARVFPSLLLRMYCRIRLLIIGPRFLNVIAQYLPERGEVLEIGCGFGLSGLYLSGLRPELVVHACDLDAKRVEAARQAASALGRSNARFEVADAARLKLERAFDAAYAIDLIHHVPKQSVPAFLEAVHERIQPGGRFLIKDVDNYPPYKRWVSWITDRVMVGFKEPIYYWPVQELSTELSRVGFKVEVRPMRDVLPYPHVLYICERPFMEF